jgi:hypothetical protein
MGDLPRDFCTNVELIATKSDKEIMDIFLNFIPDELVFFTTKCALLQRIKLLLPTGHDALLTEDGITQRSAPVTRCKHYWEEMNEGKGRLVTYDDGSVLFDGKATKMKRTTKQMTLRKKRGAGRHITFESEMPITPELRKETSPSSSANDDDVASRTDDDDDDNETFYRSQYTTANLKAIPVGPMPEKKVYTAIDLSNPDEIFYGKGGHDDFKNIEEELELFHRVQLFLKKVENKAKELLDSNQLAKTQLRAEL